MVETAIRALTEEQELKLLELEHLLKRKRSSGKKMTKKTDEHKCSCSPTGAHWWIIESPDGSTSLGICRFCHEPRLFSNWIGLEYKR